MGERACMRRLAHTRARVVTCTHAAHANVHTHAHSLPSEDAALLKGAVVQPFYSIAFFNDRILVGAFDGHIYILDYQGEGCRKGRHNP